MGTYIPVTQKEREKMLKEIGVSEKDKLFEDIPKSILLEELLDIPPGLNEGNILSNLKKISQKNTVFKSIFRGAGIYNHYIPSIVEHASSKEEFVTSYTPYQPEISQGILQAIFEYQTMICELTGMDVSNASVYDGATATAEAVVMCKEKKKDTVVLSEGLHPQIIEVVETYCFGSGLNVILAPLKCGKTDLEVLEELLDESVVAFCVAQPNFLGQIEDTEAIGSITKEKEVRYIMNCNPTSLALLKTPAECGADIAVGDGQSLGLPMSFGGPTFGFMSCTTEMMRKLPGRIVGQTTDAEGERAFVLTLQAREQHIRREKSQSNICSNQSLCALTASIYLSTIGTDGLREVAINSMSKAHYLKEKLNKIKGFKSVDVNEFFNEFTTLSPISPEKLETELSKKGILAGLPLQGKLEGNILWCATENNTREEIDNLVQSIREVCEL